MFGKSGDAPLDRDAAHARMAELLAGAGSPLTPRDAAESFVAVAVAAMANAIRSVSVARGHDVTQFALACFGGAGGQHACLVADALGVERIVIHRLSGVLSAYGMGLADRRAVLERTVTLPLATGSDATIAAAAASLAASASDDLAAQAIDRATIRIDGAALVRPASSDSTIEVPFGDVAAMRAGVRDGASPSLRLRHGCAARRRHAASRSHRGGRHRRDDDAIAADHPGSPATIAQAKMSGSIHETPIFDRATLAAGQRVDGPALIVDPVATIVVEPG